MDISKNDTAIVFIDPQNEVLSEKGLAWGLVGGSVTENNTVENMARPQRPMVSRSSSHRTISFPRTADGSSTAHWRPMRPKPNCSCAAED